MMNKNKPGAGFTLTDLLSDDSKTGQKLVHSNLSFQLKMLYLQCMTRQWIREFTRNGEEAGATFIRWEPDWNYVENCVKVGKKPIYRSSVWDNGTGMSPSDLLKYMGSLALSSKILDVDENHGSGGRGSSAWANQYGTIWMSWIDGVGHMVWLHMDEDGEFALHEWEDEDGYATSVVPTPSEYNVDSDGNPREHGTLVIFLGQHEEDHTYLGFYNETQAAGKIYQKTLNQRFWKFADGVSVDAWEAPGKTGGRIQLDQWPTARPGATKEREGGSKGGADRSPHGTAYYFQSSKHLSDSGCVDLPATEKNPSAKVHWFTFTDSQNARGQLQCHNMNSYAHTPGTVACLWKNEIYQATKANGRLRQFGIMYAKAARRLALIVEPGPDANITPDQSRATLTFPNAQALCWSAWGDLFRQNLPDSIKILLEDVVPDDFDPTKIEEDLQQALKDYYEKQQTTPIPGQPNKNKKTNPEPVLKPGGDDEEEEVVCGGHGGGGNGTGNGDGPGHGEGNGGGNTKKGSSGTDEENKVRVASRRRARWPAVFINKVDENPDRAATYDDKGSVGELRINLRHEAFQDIVTGITGMYPTTPGIEELAFSLTGYFAGLLLGVRVMDAMRYTKRSYRTHWDSNQLKTLFSDEALTLACLGVDLKNRILEAVHQKAGKAEKAA